MPAFKDLTGQIINNWKVIGFSHFDKHHASHWICECQCKNKTIKTMNIQTLKKSKDCGCSTELDLTGQKIGRWIVICKTEDTSYLAFPRKMWYCRCECGTFRNITETKLKNNKNSDYSCGCARNYKGIPRSINNNEFVFYYDYVEIKLQNDKSAFIDIDDYDLIKDDHWSFSTDGYAVSSSGKFKKKRLHRVIMGIENKPEIIVDHIDRDKLNNRKINLRAVTKHENSINQSKRKNNKSGIIGVCWWERDQNWMAQIKYNYKRYFLGYYDDFDDAVKARLEAELKFFGKDLAPQRHLFEQYGIVLQNDCEEAV